MLEIRGNSVFHTTNFAPIRSPRQDKFGGDELRTSATTAYLFLDMLYKHDYCSRSVLFSHQLSSKNLIWDPCFIMKVPKQKNVCFTFIRLAQKYESPNFHSTCARGLVAMYLFRINYCQIPSVVCLKKSHLL